MSSVAKAIRENTASETYDLKGLSQEQATEVIDAAFKDPLKLSEMVKVTLTVGAGKLNRAKYDDELPKWVCNALKDLGFEDDRGASLSMECAGSFKFQHDTGKNMKYVHVFPRVESPEGDNEDGVGNDGGNGEGIRRGGAPLSAEWLCIASQMPTFEQMVASKMPAWIEKRRCSQMLKDQIELLHGAQTKLASREELSEREQQLVNEADEDLLQQKITYLVDHMKNMVEDGKLTAAEKELVLEQVTQKIDGAKSQLDACGADQEKKRTKLEAGLKAATERKQKISAISPITHSVSNLKDLRTIWRALVPLQKLLDKAGPKGAWSAKLTPAEAEKLAEKEPLEEKEKGLLAASQHWFETEEEFDTRVGSCKDTFMSSIKATKKLGAKPPKPPANDGWATVGSVKKKSASRGGSSRGAKSSGNAFAALMD
mmetsp:Transcript_13012/g.25258  ORF Transcript_13012/g.25258 Transcript_13012/m.25258 type:complete len:428 (+) Transcript_13012:231-1514(+)|eukprot:CAMPEP_0171504192 /NCGR_PEP_ID=MMETSP0958-20121227/11408_1 /TAXON_ID=87120 /ORGANISM="Aurantiochytrium limacinum, Strain ATCCMYA-1381" /LENGTH=427 /DNA_ID=CAMNT_0012039953 /DNA_START=133 /DNA_END=1416 /DNA_ORIENTATION=+